MVEDENRLPPDGLARVLASAARRHSPTAVRTVLNEYAKPEYGLNQTHKATVLTAAASNDLITVPEIDEVITAIKAEQWVGDANPAEALQALCRRPNVTQLQLQDIRVEIRKLSLPEERGNAYAAAADNHHFGDDEISDVIEDVLNDDELDAGSKLRIFTKALHNPSVTPGLAEIILTVCPRDAFTAFGACGEALGAAAGKRNIGLEMLSEIVEEIFKLPNPLNALGPVIAAAGNQDVTDDMMGRFLKFVRKLSDVNCQINALEALAASPKATDDLSEKIIAFVKDSKKFSYSQRATVIAALAANSQTTLQRWEHICSDTTPANFPDPADRAKIYSALARNPQIPREMLARAFAAIQGDQRLTAAQQAPALGAIAAHDCADSALVNDVIRQAKVKTPSDRKAQEIVDTAVSMFTARSLHQKKFPGSGCEFVNLVDSGGTIPANAEGFCEYRSSAHEMNSRVAIMCPPTAGTSNIKRYLIVNVRQLTAMEGYVTGRFIANINAYARGLKPSHANTGPALSLRPDSHYPEHPRQHLKRNRNQR